MTVTTQHDVAREALLTAFRNAAVAGAAGVDLTAWQSTTSPRVLIGDGSGYVRGLHRGRLPCVELWEAPSDWQRQTITGGTIESTWRVRVHVPGPTWQEADSLAHAILQVGMAAARMAAYLAEGSDAIGPLLASPLGFALEAELSLVHTYCRDTYETDAEVTPGGDVGGTTFLLDFDTTTPVVVFTLPASQAIDNVEVEILTAFDGALPVLTIGTDADPALLMDEADTDLTAVGTTWERDHCELGPLTVKAFLDNGEGATAGQLRVQITTTAKGT